MEFDIQEITDLSGDKARVYSVIVDGDSNTLLEQFFNDNQQYTKELKKIIEKINVMSHVTGCRESFFKKGEGAWGDGMVALNGTGCLRLYGIYFNNAIVLFGSGGYKPPHIRSYQQDYELNLKAQQMRAIAAEINKKIADGDLKISNDKIISYL